MRRFGPRLYIEDVGAFQQSLTVTRAPQQISTGFESWFRYCTDIAQRRSTKRSLAVYRAGSALYILRLLPPNGILPGTKFTLRPSLALSYIGSVTARHSSSGRQPNFAAWYKE